MSTPSEPRREHPSTYFVQDRSNEEEMHRLTVQDHMLTTGMGGVLPEQTDPSQFRRVLDVGCGTGGWLLEMAQALPDTTQLVGVDISGKMIDYARTRAEELQLGDRVKFQTGDALRRLEFPSYAFDLVNMRLGTSYLRTLDWPKLLSEFRRVTRPGGTVRITEAEIIVRSSSSALTQLCTVALQAMYHGGHFFKPQADGVTGELVSLLDHHGFKDVQSHFHPITYHAGTEEFNSFAENMRLISRTGAAFYKKWTNLPEDGNDLYAQMIADFQQPDFSATWPLLTVWGIVP